MKYKHYAPRAEMTLVSGEEENIAAYMRRECKKRSGEKIGLLVRDLEFFADVPQNAEVLVLGRCEKAVAQNLFARLREFDRLGVDAIFAEATAENGLGVAISDRMRKASEGRIVYV
jgi:L-threonylcarbamoyladenylate synthase